MTDYFVGPGGNDANSGLTWALRKLTLNGAEDVPVVAGDVVYVGPGVYRELLTLDVSGNAGNLIIYIGDVTGENTDGVGGIVRVTGSDNDQTNVRFNCINTNSQDYRTFRGFRFDLATFGVYINGSEFVLLEDCVLVENFDYGVRTFGNTQNDITIRRCLLSLNGNADIFFSNDNTVDDTDNLVEDCLFIGCHATFSPNIDDQRIGGITARNCTFHGGIHGIQIVAALSIGQTFTVNNCILAGMRAALNATAVGEIVENFNTFFNNDNNRVNTNVGANSQTYPPLFNYVILYSGASQISGFKLPWWEGELSEWSQIRAITGLNEPAVDLRGLIRPATAAKNSWGSTQFMEMERAVGTVRTGVSSMVLLDAGINQMFIPITAEEITVEVYVQREGAYAGVNPQMILKQPGQADRVTLDAGAAGAWNLLTDTFTPAALPPYVIVEFVSNNIAVAGAFSTFFDDLEVS